MANRSLPLFNAVLIPTLLCLLAIHSASAKEPVYDGKPLSQWLCCEPLEDAQNAVQKIGTNAIPTLLDMVGITEKTKKRVAGKIESETIRRDARSGDLRIDDVQNIAVEKGFSVLGTNAESAIPKLVKLLDDEETSGHAAQALAVVGPKGFAALTNYMTTGHMRGSVVMALGEKGGGDRKLVTQLLVNALNDENPGIRANAADGLADKDPELAIPALIRALDDKESDVQQWSACSLGHYGSAAKDAAPKLLTLFTNGQDRMGMVFEALPKIDRETAGKAEEFIINSGPLGARSSYTKTLLNNGKELVAGGWVSTRILVITNRCLSKCELFDPKTGKWTETGEMNIARSAHEAILLRDGRVLVVGGSDSKGHALASAELFDLISEKWTKTGSLTFGRFYHKATLQPDGKVLVSGGHDGINPLSSKELYDPTTAIWTVIANPASITR